MTDLLSVAFYTLGFVGLAGATMIPLRSWQLYRRYSRLPWRTSLSVKLLSFAVGLAISAVLIIEYKMVSGVFRCLIGEHCGPNRASGWIYLASLGVFYLLFELVGAVFWLLAHRISRVAT
jgi:hypothetical protein